MGMRVFSVTIAIRDANAGGEHGIISPLDDLDARPMDRPSEYDDRNHEECSRVEMAREDVLEHILFYYRHSERET